MKSIQDWIANSIKNSFYSIIFCIILLFIVDLDIYTTYSEIILLNNGIFTYCLDDLYIHMAIAKNLITHGIWGVTSSEFTSSSSSILYPLLISFIWILGGINELTPLWINIVSVNLFVIVMFRLLKKQGLHPILVFILVLVLLVILPINFLIFTGLEHVLFCFTMVIFIDIIQTHLEYPEKSVQTKTIQIISLILISLRYESLFFMGAIYVVFKFSRKKTVDIRWLIVSILPVFIYGIISLSNGWNILPASLTLKTNLLNFNFNELTYEIIYQLLIFFGIIVGVGIVTMVVNKENILKRHLSNSSIWTLTFILTLIGHLFLGRLSNYSNLYRYECYLIVLGFICLIMNFKELYKWFFSLHLYHSLKSKKRAEKPNNVDINLNALLIFSILFTVCIIPIHSRITDSHQAVTLSSRNIYLHYYFPALFFRTYYNSSTGLLIHDIGYITYLGDYRIYDHNFLGSKPIETENLTETLYLRNIYIGLLWPEHFEMPTGWITVAIYHIEETTIITPHTIYFCASNSTEAILLKNYLLEFSSVLPDSVHIEYLI